MCVAVDVRDITAEAPLWDRDRVTIVIGGRGLTYFDALKQVRALLTWLGAPQIGTGAICWCGDPVTIPKIPVIIPQQKTAPACEKAPHAS